ncbi:hypothetical protein [Verrucomicrobium sp. BvORR106]|uniref:hypothetical protein n=1 Tax=Verrucomicrobium sp. BvORR106 TaxID=1403819 RepID=UPI00056F0326|nr:hypothetical protein [Verrucomicrobium sp. BvORR106]
MVEFPEYRQSPLEDKGRHRGWESKTSAPAALLKPIPAGDLYHSPRLPSFQRGYLGYPQPEISGVEADDVSFSLIATNTSTARWSAHPTLNAQEPGRLFHIFGKHHYPASQRDRHFVPLSGSLTSKVAPAAKRTSTTLEFP